MKQQVVAIHGGDSYATYEEFLSNLTKSILRFDWLNFRDWKSKLSESLGNNYEVILPRMPNAQNAKYAEWKIWFEKLIPHLTDGVILVGHSLGGSFLAKFLSEETFPHTIRGTFLVSAPFDSDGGRKLVEFDQTNDLRRLREQGGAIFLYHSKDDPVVPIEEVEKYTMLLPDAMVRIFPDRQHFNQAEFTELIEDIRSLSPLS